MYLIELGKCGYEEGPMCRLNLADRLDSLRAVQKVWDAPQPKVLFKKTMRFPNVEFLGSAVWTINSGMLVRTFYEIPVNGKTGVRLDFICIRHVAHELEEDPTPFFGVALFDFDWVDFKYRMNPEQQLLIMLNDNG